MFGLWLSTVTNLEKNKLMSNQEIINQIKEHILKEASSWSNWYVGITNDANRRLFEEHKVDKDNG